jgi:hypothetical protein
MIYYYTKTTIPDLDTLEIAILNSSISSTYEYFRWDEGDDKLKVHLNRELNSSEKIVLDGLVALV